MAFPASFDESNAVLGKPVDMEECDALAVCLTRIDESPVVVSCWKLTAEELAEVNRTGRVWLMIWGPTMQPACIMGTKPFSPAPIEKT